jgi:hypothetical protein
MASRRDKGKGERALPCVYISMVRARKENEICMATDGHEREGTERREQRVDEGKRPKEKGGWHKRALLIQI